MLLLQNCHTTHNLPLQRLTGKRMRNEERSNVATAGVVGTAALLTYFRNAYILRVDGCCARYLSANFKNYTNFFLINTLTASSSLSNFEKQYVVKSSN